MKNSIMVIIVILLGLSCKSQKKDSIDQKEVAPRKETEFGTSRNGLIYSAKAINHLKQVVDSLNLKHKVCDLNKMFLSKSQTKAHYIELDTGDVKAALKDIEGNISFEDFEKKYRQSEIEKDLLVIKFECNEWDDERKKDVSVLFFQSVELGQTYERGIGITKNLDRYKKFMKGKWVYEYYKKSEYSKERIYAFYFTENFMQNLMPEKYAKMIQYSECMIDTTTLVFYEELNASKKKRKTKEKSKTTIFIEYVDRKTDKPIYDDKNWGGFREKLQIWDSVRFVKIDKLRKEGTQFDESMRLAVNEAIEEGGSTEELENYVERYYSPQIALELMRRRHVIGFCSMDAGPRVHAANIARLSAETENWKVFLRAHLDIMNDRFDRASDGSYAWAGRKTYIKELEVLDINVLDLLLGISLRIQNPSINHYYGSIGRLGRALSETKNSEKIEAEMLNMICDNNLDDYNRILIYYLFLNYNNNLEDVSKQKVNEAKIETAKKHFPDYISSRLMSKNR